MALTTESPAIRDVQPDEVAVVEEQEVQQDEDAPARPFPSELPMTPAQQALGKTPLIIFYPALAAGVAAAAYTASLFAGVMPGAHYVIICLPAATPAPLCDQCSG